MNKKKIINKSIYLCFKYYNCKLCPKNAQCEKENRNEVGKSVKRETREVHTKHS